MRLFFTVITRIVLENFMSHRHTVIEPAAGLTLLVGPNNCGKSAVVTALQVLMENEHAERFVRHNAKFASIRVETSEGHSIEWRREGKTVSYRINGREVHRLKGGVPEDLHELLRMQPVVVTEGNGEFQVHVAEQKRPIFLIDEPSGRAATFFASASDTRLLLKMQQLLKERRKDRKKESEQIQARVEGSRRELERYAPLAQLSELLSTAETQYRTVVEAGEHLAKGQDLVGVLGHAQSTVGRLGPARTVLEKLHTVPQQEPEEPLKQVVEGMSRRLQRLEIARTRAQKLRPLTPEPSVLPARDLAHQISQISSNIGQCARLRSEALALDRLTASPQMVPVGDLERFVRTLESTVARTLAVQQSAGSMTRLGPPVAVSDLTELKVAVAGLIGAEERRKVALQSAGVAEANLDTVRQETRRYVSLHPSCPICGGILTEAQVIEGHRHG